MALHIILKSAACAVGTIAFACAIPALHAEQLPSKSGHLRNAYFGDLHVHTSYSLDGFIYSNTLDPEVAYQFARGREVTLATGIRHSLSIPLDFVAVTDHAEYFGERTICLDQGHSEYDNPLCRDIRNRNNDAQVSKKVFENLILKDMLSAHPTRTTLCGVNGTACKAAARTAWQKMQAIANEYYEPGVFTTFIGYEWTSSPNGANLHRNVIFRNDRVPDDIYSHMEAETPKTLRDLLKANCTGDCDVLVIPHNPNLSRGRQFSALDRDGTPLSAEQASLRIALEPLVEIMQSKGDSECRIGLGTDDEFCNFEKVNQKPVCPGGLDNRQVPDCAPECDAAGQPRGCISRRNFVRNALKDGLLLERQLGVNPFKLGLVGSTDTHNSTPGATREDDYKGHYVTDDQTPLSRARMPLKKHILPQRLKNPGGLAAVWAETNTRDAIFDALKRRETFATSGTRIRVRFFAGWDYSESMIKQPDLVQQAYAGGVPMGGDLYGMAGEEFPKFVIWATKAMDGSYLQRLQVIKGWVDKDKTYERVFDVACSDGLLPDRGTHRCPDNGANVDLTDCSASTGLGAVELKTLWEDPEFNPGQRAFYYARVLENPSCRWSSFDAIRGQQPLFENLPPVIQERAWTSPIWYTPMPKNSSANDASESLLENNRNVYVYNVACRA